jgi:tetratricopeptide (TPR) repeat protein
MPLFLQHDLPESGNDEAQLQPVLPPSVVPEAPKGEGSDPAFVLQKHLNAQETPLRGKRGETRPIRIILTELRAALDAGDYDRAIALGDEALASRPGHAQAHLLRGQARAQAGFILTALADFYRVIAGRTESRFTSSARLEAARILELQGETTRALDLLAPVRSAAADARRAALERRVRGEPAVLLLDTEALVMHDTLTRTNAGAHTHAIFAVVVRAIGRPQYGGGDNWLNSVVSAGVEFVEIIGGLRNAPGDPVLSLRLISRPNVAVAERGRIDAALLVRVTALDGEDARQQAQALWRTLAPLLPSAGRAYYFEPVMDDVELSYLTTPFEADALYEIVRREETMREGGRYALYPFTAGRLDLHTLSLALLRQPAPAMISIHLLPTTLMAWEEAAIDRSMTQGPDISPSLETVNPDADPVWRYWQTAPQMGRAQANRHLIDQLRANAYVLAINVAGSAGCSPLLAHQCAAALLGALQNANGAIYGGYEIVQAFTDTERKAALANLATVDVENWVFTAAPEGCSRLRHLVSEGEAALAFRLPVPDGGGIPGLRMIETKPVPPPAHLPSTGTVFGESVARISGSPVRIIQSEEDRRRHAYILGKTGAGKTTLIENLALQDIEAGRGVCVIDPHGDLYNDLLARIPEHRAADVVLFDASDTQRPVGMNLLEWRTEEEMNFIANEFIGLLMMMYDPGGSNLITGPRFQHNVRNAMLTAMHIEGGTLVEVMRILVDFVNHFRFVRKILPLIQDPLLKLFWTQIMNTSDYHRSEALDYFVSKLSRFVNDTRVRNIVGQRKSTIDFRSVMDREQILLVNLSKGMIGPENAQFLGLLLVQRLLLTALSRADMPADQRPDFMLYVDEFQNFATPMFSTVLSEGRKYGVSATLANQYLTQLGGSTREAIFGNIGTFVSFRLGLQDALMLAPEVHPSFDPGDLVNLPAYTTATKLLVDGVASAPFAMRTLPDLRMPNDKLARAIKGMSRELYGRAVNDVKQDIYARFGADWE